MSLPPLDTDFLRETWRGHRFGDPLIYASSVESTNDLALELLDRGFPEGALVVAEEQTRGRGRRGRSWASPPRLGIYASLLLRPPRNGIPLPLLTFSAALGVSQALEEATGLSVGIKWPNDLLVGERKVAGLLAEARSVDESAALVVGLGINVNQDREDFPEGLRDRATSLREAAGRMVDRSRLLSRLIGRWEEEHRCLLETGATETLLRWERRSFLRPGGRVQAEMDGRPLQGVFRGVTPSGEMRLELEGGEVRTIAFGEVRPVREGP